MPVAAVLLTASGLGAAAPGFGTRPLVENLLSGLMLDVHPPFAVGDPIELPAREDAEGLVDALREWLTHHPHVKCGLSSEPDHFHAMAQELLLAVQDRLDRRGGRLAAGS